MKVSRLGRAAVATALLAALAVGATGCRSEPIDLDDEGTTTAQGLQQTLGTLRDPWGLVVDPTYYDQQGSAYSTALLDQATGEHRSYDPEAAREVCASGEAATVGEPWFSWAVVTTFGRLPDGCGTLKPPTRTGDLATDVPRYWAWATASLASGRPRADVATQASAVLQGDRSSRSPYVMWRLDQLEELLDLPSTAASRPTEPPAVLASPDDLTELWGATMRCQARPQSCPEASAISDQAIAIAATSFPDDLSLAGALAVLRAREADGYVEVLEKAVAARRTPTDGLVRQARFVGSIDATFLSLQLAPGLFPGPEPDVTAAELRRRLSLVPTSDTVRRMRALAVLKAVDPAAVTAWQPEIDAVYASYDGVSISSKQLKGYVSVVAAFGEMGIDAPMAKLKVFTTHDDESRYLATVAAGSAWAFRNDKEILTTYAQLRRRALKAATSPSGPVASYTAGLLALSGPGIDVSARQRSDIEAATSQLRGCDINGRRTEDLYRFEFDPSASCSLTITSDLRKSSFGGN